MIKNKTSVELRKFALVMTVALAVISLLLFWRHKPAAPYFGGVAGLFFILGLIWPRCLAPAEWAWMKLAHFLGTIMTYVIVTFTFYLVITPMGMILRLMGKDLLRLKLDRNATSYWVSVDPGGPCSRSDKPY